MDIDRFRLSSKVAVLAALLACVPSPAQAAVGLSDPTGSSVLIAAIRWIEGTLLGPVATSIAVIAVASIGFQMLSGRTSWRYGAQVVLGCFIIFGASSIARGILSAAGNTNAPPALVASAPPAYPVVAAPPPAQSDPFAGAALPSR